MWWDIPKWGLPAVIILIAFWSIASNDTVSPISVVIISGLLAYTTNRLIYRLASLVSFYSKRWEQAENERLPISTDISPIPDAFSKGQSADAYLKSLEFRPLGVVPPERDQSEIRAWHYVSRSADTTATLAKAKRNKVAIAYFSLFNNDAIIHTNFRNGNHIRQPNYWASVSNESIEAAYSAHKLLIEAMKVKQGTHPVALDTPEKFLHAARIFRQRYERLFMQRFIRHSILTLVMYIGVFLFFSYDFLMAIGVVENVGFDDPIYDFLALIAFATVLINAFYKWKIKPKEITELFPSAKT